MRLQLKIAALFIALQGLGFPTQADWHEADNCSAELWDDDNDGTDCAFVAVSSDLKIKGIASVTHGVCQSDDESMPFYCDADTSTGAIPGNVALFVDDDGTEWNGGDKFLDVWVKVDSTFCFVGVVCGVDVTLCNDRDLSGVCTNTGLAGDQLVSGQSNMPILVTKINGVNCDASVETCEFGFADCTNQNKDTKDCGDNFDARLFMCASPNFAWVPSEWMPGQIMVFVGLWADAMTSGNLGAGLTPGIAEVWLDYQDANCDYLTSCNDGQDNDGDGFRDYPADTGCSASFDDDEFDNSTVSCGSYGSEIYADIEGPAGTTATCKGNCPGRSMLNAAAWDSGAGTIHVSMQGCGLPAGSAPADANSGNHFDQGDYVNTGSGVYICTITILDDWASGTGYCNDPPQLPLL